MCGDREEPGAESTVPDPGKSLIGTEAPLLGNLEIMAQFPPDVPGIDTVLDQLNGGPSPSRQNMRPHDPPAVGVAEFRVDESIKLMEAHGDNPTVAHHGPRVHRWRTFHMNAVQLQHIRVVSAHVNNRSIFNVRDLAYSAVFAALIIVLGYISIPVGAAGVPIVLQNAACIMAGLILGPRRGFLALLIVFLLGMVGLPVLAQGKSVLTALSGPTIGYLLGYLLAPLIAGVLSARAPRNRAGMALNFALAFLAALLVQYLFGVLGLMWRLDMTLTDALKVQIPFIPGAVVKLVIGVIVAVGVHTALPDLRGFGSRPVSTPGARAA